MTQHSVVLRPQPWDWPGPRVLLEQVYSADTIGRVDALRRAGFAVSVCPGPTAEDRCPLAGDEGCAAAHGADVVVSSLGLETAEAREALAALHARLPRLPVLVEAAAEVAARWPDLVRADDRLEVGIGGDALVERVRLALQERRRALA
jgi:DNA-binding NarL/FixJ family response regulator